MEHKREIEELVAIYELEESIKDIYVEGNTDKAFFQWIVDSGNGLSEVYTIDNVLVPDELLDEASLAKGSSRSRIIAASIAVSSSLPKANNVIFVADKDFSHYLSEKFDSSILEFTDYNSLELYAMNERSIKKMMATSYGRFEGSVSDFIDCLACILRDLYALRLANIDLGWGMAWVELKRYVSVGELVAFDRDKFIDAYLGKNSFLGRKEEFLAKFEEFKSALLDDHRLSVRGHDFTSLLMHVLNKKYPSRKIDKPEVFEGVLLNGLEREQLLKENLISKLWVFSECG